jgi:hypothetical protein
MQASVKDTLGAVIITESPHGDVKLLAKNCMQDEQ